MAKQLQVNKRVYIMVEDGSYQGSYISKIAEIGDDSFKTTTPFLQGEIVPLRIQQKVQVFYTGDNAAYAFAAEVIDRENNPVALLTLKKTSEVRRIQRREYFRVHAKRKVSYKVIENISDALKDQSKFSTDNQETAAASEEQVDQFRETMTIDISGGGIKIVADDYLPEKGLIEFYLDIPGLEDNIIIGEIINYYNLPDGQAAGIEFIDISQGCQDIIIGWLFDFQRKLRQRGLL